MFTKNSKVTGFVAAYLLAMTSLTGSAIAQSTSSSPASDTKAAGNTRGDKATLAAMKHVNDAVEVVHRMESEPGVKSLLQQAKGVFIVPSYGRAALGIGGSGGAGVLLAKRDDGTWSDPAFYNLGAISIGLQAGAEGGPIAMILNNDKAVNHFLQKNNFSLSADAGLTVVNWAKAAQGEAGTGDVVAWAGNKGLFGNVASIGVNDIRFNQKQNDAYYHKTVAVRDVISGKIKNPQADTLKQALAATSTGTASGGSGASPARGGASGGSSGNSATHGSK